MNTRTHNRTVVQYIEQSEPSARELIEALMQIGLESEPRMEEAIKWNRITFTLNGNWHHWICGIERTRKYVSFIFHKGALLNDTSRILQGTGKYTRQIRITSLADINRKALIDLIKQAVAKQTAML
jgi:hypothetical protein